MFQRLLDLWWGFRYFRRIKGQPAREAWSAARRLAADEDGSAPIQAK